MAISLKEIMHEQNSEKRARQKYNKYNKRNNTALDEEQAQLELAMILSMEEAEKNKPSLDADLDRVLALSLQENNQNTNLEQTKNDQDLTLALSLQDKENNDGESDFSLALFLQEEEKRRYGIDQSTKKHFTPMEEKIYNMQIGVDEDDEEEEIDNPEYVYLEPHQLQENPTQLEPQILYDASQKKEDQEIVHVSKRMVEKRVNSVPYASHHIEYKTRNKGKDHHLIIPGAYENKKINNPKNTEKNTPIDDDNHAFGLALHLKGGGKVHVYCFRDCTVKYCRITKKLYKRIMINPGDYVLLRLRPYQETHADIVYRYQQEEWQDILGAGIITLLDPVKYLSNDTFYKTLLPHKLPFLFTLRLVSWDWYKLIKLYYENYKQNKTQSVIKSI